MTIKLIFNTCPKCNNYLISDDIDDKYRNERIEYSHCPICQIDYRAVIANGKVISYRTTK